MLALLDERLVHPVRVFESVDAVYGDPWLFFLALDPVSEEVCELIGWTEALGANGPYGSEPARACYRMMVDQGYRVMKSTHYENGKPRLKFLPLERSAKPLADQLNLQERTP